MSNQLQIINEKTKNITELNNQLNLKNKEVDIVRQSTENKCNVL